MKQLLRFINVLSIVLSILGIFLLVLINLKSTNLSFIEDSKISGSTTDKDKGLNIVISLLDYQDRQNILIKKADDLIVCNVTIENEFLYCVGESFPLEKEYIVGQIYKSIPFLGVIVDIYQNFLTWLIIFILPLFIVLVGRLKIILPTFSVKTANFDEADIDTFVTKTTLMTKILEKEEKFIDKIEPKIFSTTEKIEEKTKKVKDKLKY